MNIYSSVDGKNIDKIIILFNSVYINANKEKQSELKFYLLVDKLPDKLPFIPDYLEPLLEIKELDLNTKWLNLLDDFNTYFYKSSSWCKSNMNFARFVFFNHFPEVDRVVYLDWDMIVLADIFEINSEYNSTDNMIIANCGKQTTSTNIFIPEFRFSTSIQSLYLSKKLKHTYHRSNVIFKYLKLDVSHMCQLEGFNAGFYIVSKEHFNDEYLTSLLRKLITIQKKFSCFNFGTQVVMNLMHIKNRIFIEKIWNHLPNISNLYSLKIIHWNGTQKPWSSKLITNNIWYDYCFKVYPEYQQKFTYQQENIQSNNKKPSNKIIIKNSNKENNLLKFISSKR